MPSRDDIEALMDYATLGEQVKQFMLSDVGKYMLKRASNEYTQGVLMFKNASVRDTATMIEAQTMMLRAERIQEWLQEAVTTGLKAIEVLEGREDGQEAD